MEIKRRIGWSWAEGNSLVGLGYLYWDQKQYTKVAEYYEQAVKAYVKAGDLNSANGIVNDLARTYSILHQYPKAVECLEKWVETARQHKNPRIEADALAHLGTLLDTWGQDPKGIEYLHKSVEMSKEHKDPRIEAEASARLGACYVTRGEYSAAAKYFEESSESAKKVKNLDLQQKALRNLGSACERLGQNSKAIRAYEDALQIAAKPKDAKARVKMAFQLAYLYYEERNYAKAAEHYLSALESGGKLDDPNLHALEWGEKLGHPTVAKKLEGILGKIYREWVKIDPGNEQLKRVKTVLDRGAENQALAEQITQAIEATHIDKVKELPVRPANANVCDKHGRLPLETAAEKGDMELVRQLIDGGADLKIKNGSGIPALEAAFTAAMRRCHEEVARYFLDIGANVNAVGPKEITPLQLAMTCSPDFVKTLLEKGADLNARGKDGVTLLMHAAKAGNLEVVKLLVDRGADVNATDNYGRTPLMAAAWRMHVKGANDSTHESHDGNERGNIGQTVLTASADRGNIEVIKFLIDKGADLNAQDNYGFTALMSAAYDCKVEGTRLLLDNGADVNAKNALSMVVASLEYPSNRVVSSDRLKSCFEVVKLLLQRGADVNSKDYHEQMGSRTALLRFCASPPKVSLKWSSCFWNTELK